VERMKKMEELSKRISKKLDDLKKCEELALLIVANIIEAELGLYATLSELEYLDFEGLNEVENRLNWFDTLKTLKLEV
jgi:hypothetical protein